MNTFNQARRPKFARLTHSVFQTLLGNGNDGVAAHFIRSMTGFNCKSATLVHHDVPSPIESIYPAQCPLPTVMDFKAQDDRDRQSIFKIVLESHHHSINSIVNHLAHGRSQYNLPITLINLINERATTNMPSPKFEKDFRFIDCLQLSSETFAPTSIEVIDLMRLYQIDLPLVKLTDVKDPTKREWLQLLSQAQYFSREPALSSSTVFKAYKKIELDTFNEELSTKYSMECIDLTPESRDMETEYKLRANLFDIAQRLRSLGMDSKHVSFATGISPEELAQIEGKTFEDE